MQIKVKFMLAFNLVDLKPKTKTTATKNGYIKSYQNWTNLYDSKKSHSICIESFSWMTAQIHKSVTVTVHSCTKNSLHNLVT